MRPVSATGSSERSETSLEPACFTRSVRSSCRRERRSCSTDWLSSDGRPHVDRDAAKRLGRNLWLARRRAGYSQEALGDLCGLHRTEVGMVENGQRLPRVDTLMKLATALEIGVEKLVEGIEWISAAPSASGG